MGYIIVRGDNGVTEVATYTVRGVHCAQCEAAIERELVAVAGVDSVDVDLASKLVTVRGHSLDDDKLREAIDEAGYDVG